MPNIYQVLQVKGLRIIKSPRDGHCLFHSFLSSWNDQVKSPRLDLDGVWSAATSEWHSNRSLYLPFINTTTVSADDQWKRYLFEKQYNQPIGDIFPHILANTFKLDIIILNELHQGTFEKINVTSANSDSLSLYLHRVNDNHYNGIGGVLAQKKPNVNTRISYSRDNLIALNNKGNVARSVRKSLFKNKIWNPRSANNNKEPVLNHNLQSQQSVNVNNQTDCDKPECTLNTINSPHGIKIGLLNPCSVCNKALLIRDYIIDNCLDVLAITEVWSLTDSVIAELKPEGYDIKYNLRNDGRKGGGVALICKNSLKLNELSKFNFKSYEAILASFKVNAQFVYVFLVYAPRTKTSKSYHDEFIAEFDPVLSSDLCTRNNLILLGDFNYHVNDPHDLFAKDFLSVLDSYGFKQYVDFPTHVSGNTLDLIFSRELELPLCKFAWDALVSPDHFSVLCELSLDKPSNDETTFTTRLLIWM